MAVPQDHANIQECRGVYRRPHSKTSTTLHPSPIQVPRGGLTTLPPSAAQVAINEANAIFTHRPTPHPQTNSPLQHRCRRDISLVSNLPIGTSFGSWNISQSFPVKGATTNAFLFGFTEILLSKSAPNLDALIPLNRAKSYDPNDPTFTFIPILEGEIWNLPVLCLHTFAG